MMINFISATVFHHSLLQPPPLLLITGEGDSHSYHGRYGCSRAPGWNIPEVGERPPARPLLPHSRELSRPLLKLDFLQPHAFASSLLRPIPNWCAKERKQQKAIHRHSQRQTTGRRVVVSASVSVCTAYITVSGRLPPLLTQLLIPIARDQPPNQPPPALQSLLPPWRRTRGSNRAPTEDSNEYVQPERNRTRVCFSRQYQQVRLFCVIYRALSLSLSLAINSCVELEG